MCCSTKSRLPLARMPAPRASPAQQSMCGQKARAARAKGRRRKRGRGTHPSWMRARTRGAPLPFPQAPTPTPWWLPAATRTRRHSHGSPVQARLVHLERMDGQACARREPARAVGALEVLGALVLHNRSLVLRRAPSNANGEWVGSTHKKGAQEGARTGQRQAAEWGGAAAVIEYAPRSP